MKDKVTYFTLSNGLRAVHISRNAPVAYCGLAIRAGSGDEDLDNGEAGLAHFVEHCIFKGTTTRSAEDIRNCMEEVGGELNAFTGKDDTVVYSIFPSGNIRRALSLIADITIRSTFPTEQIDKEREVVEAEIDSYLDTPSEQVFDDFEDIVLRGTPLGHNILGTAENIARFNTAVCRSWVDRHYAANRCTLFFCGRTSPTAFSRIAEKFFSDMPATAPAPERSAARIPAVHGNSSQARDTHQAHTVMGTAVEPLPTESKYAMSLLTNILGGPGMNSLLNVELREKLGLVYTVEAAATYYSQATLFTVYFGCDPEETARCKRLVRKVISNMAEKPLSESALAATKRQYLGQMVIAGDNIENHTISIARATLLHGRARTSDEITSSIQTVTSDDIVNAARLLLRPASLTVHPE